MRCNLSDFATAGAKCKVDPGVTALLKAMHEAGKPIAALCISPAVIAAIFGKELTPELTLGKKGEPVDTIEAMGAKHFEAEPTEILVDAENMFVTTPCYMTAGSISEVAVGIEKALRMLLAMTEKPMMEQPEKPEEEVAEEGTPSKRRVPATV